MALGRAVDAAQGRCDAGKAIDPLQSSECRQVPGKLPRCFDPLAHATQAVADRQELARSIRVELGETRRQLWIIESDDLYQPVAIEVIDPFPKLAAKRTGGIGK